MSAAHEKRRNTTTHDDVRSSLDARIDDEIVLAARLDAMRAPRFEWVMIIASAVSHMPPLALSADSRHNVSWRAMLPRKKRRRDVDDFAAARLASRARILGAGPRWMSTHRRRRLTRDDISLSGRWRRWPTAPRARASRCLRRTDTISCFFVIPHGLDGYGAQAAIASLER